MIGAGAASQIGSELELFAIAVVLVSPFAYRRIRRTLAERRERLEPTDSADGGAADGGAADGDGPGSAAGNGRRARGRGGRAGGRGAGRAEESGPLDLGPVIASIDGGTGEFEVVVPAGATLGGRPAPDAVVRQLVDDALRRSEVEVMADETEDGERRLRLTRRLHRESPGT